MMKTSIKNHAAQAMLAVAFFLISLGNVYAYTIPTYEECVAYGGASSETCLMSVGTNSELIEALEDGLDPNEHFIYSIDYEGEKRSPLGALLTSQNYSFFFCEINQSVVAEKTKTLLAYGANPELPWFSEGIYYEGMEDLNRNYKYHPRTLLEIANYFRNEMLTKERGENWICENGSDRGMKIDAWYDVWKDIISAFNSADSTQPGSLELSITDGCRDGRDIQYRIFGYSTSSPSGEYIGMGPESGLVYIADDSGEKVTNTYACKTEDGETVRSWCYGADRPDGDYWGVGIDGEEGCDDCCASCPATGTSARWMDLICDG